MSIIKEVILKARFSTEDLNSTATQAKAALQPINELGEEIEQTFKNAFSTKEVKEFDAASNKAVSQLTSKLAKMKKEGKENTNEFKEIQKQINQIDKDNGIGKITQKSLTLKQELRKLKEELTSGNLTGKEFEVATQRAAQMQDAIIDVNNRIKTLATDGADVALRGFSDLSTGIIGGFTAAQGAMALFGSENEDLQKQLVKLQGATALLNGIQQINATLQGDSAAMVALNAAKTKILTFVTNGATVATRAFNAALIATGVGAIIVGLGTIVAYWDEISQFIGLSNKDLENQKKLNEQINDLVKERRNEIENYNKEFTGSIGQARLDLVLAEKRGESESKILQLKKFLNLTEQDAIKNKLRYNGLTGDALNLEQTRLRILQAEFIGLEKNTKEIIRQNEELIKGLQLLIGNDLDRQLDVVIKKAAELYVDTFNRGNKKIGDNLLANLTKVDVEPLQIPIEIQNAIAIKKYFKDELPLDFIDGMSLAADTLFQINANKRQAEFDAEVENLNRIKDARLQNEDVTAQEKLVIQAQFDRDLAKLREQQYKREQQAAIAQAILNGALAITTLATKTPPAIGGAPNPAFFAGLSLLIGQTAAQVAIIKSTPPPAFKEGVIDFKGKGTGTSDSNHVMISKGESVMTAMETKEHGDALMAIRKGQFDKFVNQRAFELERYTQAKTKTTERRSNIRKKSTDRMIIDNFDQIGASVASRLNYAGYTKRR